MPGQQPDNEDRMWIRDEDKQHILRMLSAELREEWMLHQTERELDDREIQKKVYDQGQRMACMDTAMKIVNGSQNAIRVPLEAEAAGKKVVELAESFYLFVITEWEDEDDGDQDDPDEGDPGPFDDEMTAADGPFNLSA